MDIEERALALVNEVQKDRWPEIDRDFHMHEVENSTPFIALCRAIEAHEAFRQEVSDAVRSVKVRLSPHNLAVLSRFIIQPETDPLVEAVCAAISDSGSGDFVAQETLRAVLAKRGLEIREVGE